MNEDQLCESISRIINGYRDNQFGTYDNNHVKRWISQFEPEERLLVLKETNRILKKCFISKDDFLKFADNVIASAFKHEEDKNNNFWKSVSLLDIQLKGSSQTQLNDIFCSKLHSTHKINNTAKKQSDDYIYLDDFIFSGNRLYADMDNWIKNSAPKKCNVYIIVLGWYCYGQWSTKCKLEKLVTQLNKEIKFHFVSYEEHRLENRLFRKDNSNVLWPTKHVENLPGVLEYIKKENFKPIYRESNGIKNKVFSRSRRDQYEEIMLKYGIKILSFSKVNSPVVKPLGYNTFRGFGFGSVMFSFRNCPNNNPLAFWWGDPNSPTEHPFSKWYPLMQRNTYG